MAAVGSLGDAIDLLTRVGFAGGESAAGGSASAAAGTPPSLAAALTALSESIRRRELLVMCMPARPVYTEWATLSLFPHSSAVTLWCGCVGVPPPPPLPSGDAGISAGEPLVLSRPTRNQVVVSGSNLPSGTSRLTATLSAISGKPIKVCPGVLWLLAVVDFGCCCSIELLTGRCGACVSGPRCLVGRCRPPGVRALRSDHVGFRRPVQPPGRRHALLTCTVVKVGCLCDGSTALGRCPAAP